MYHKFRNLIIIEFSYQFEFHRRHSICFFGLNFCYCISHPLNFSYLLLYGTSPWQKFSWAHRVFKIIEKIYFTLICLWLNGFQVRTVFCELFQCQSRRYIIMLVFTNYFAWLTHVTTVFSLSRWVIGATVFKVLRGIFFSFFAYYTSHVRMWKSKKISRGSRIYFRSELAIFLIIKFALLSETKLFVCWFIEA